MVRMKTITIEPHPLSITARGGIIIARKTRKQPIMELIIYRQSSEKNMSFKNPIPTIHNQVLTAIKSIAYV